MKDQQQRREPIFKGPWPVWTVAGVILASYAVQSLLLSDEAALSLALIPADVFRGRWTPLVTAMFIHGNWVHAGLNALGALAWGAWAARYLGVGFKGAAGYFVLFLLCGVLSSLGYVLVHPHLMESVAGASGAVSGLLGASTRLLGRRDGLAPLLNRQVVASSAAWVVINAVMGVLHYEPGIGHVNLAWEAHIIGYFAGLLLIGPFGAVFGTPRQGQDSADEIRDGSSQSEG